MRSGVSMIELVFAIVIMGVAMMTIPTMLAQSSAASLVSTQQEAILAGTTKMGNVLSHSWDANQTGIDRSRVLYTTDGDSAFNEHNSTYKTRRGHFIGDQRRRFADDNATSASIGSGVTGNYVDAFIGNDNVLVSGSGEGDYIREYKTDTDVFFISDSLSSGSYDDSSITFTVSPTSSTPSTNIKYITVNVTSENPGEDDISIQLFSFVSNIGQTDILSKEMQ